MSAKFFKIPFEPLKSFNFRVENPRELNESLHFHPELELRYIVSGKGIQYIGDEVSSFAEGDLFLLGENLPHAWRFDLGNAQKENSGKIESQVIEFSTQFSSQFSKFPEAHSLKTLFEKAKQGLIIKGESKLKLIELFQKFKSKGSSKNLALLLELVSVLSETHEYSIISPGYVDGEKAQLPELYRFEKVFLYIKENYKDEIKLDEVAALANLSPTSFCRYFKSITNQTLIEYVTQIRISKACSKLIEKNDSILAVSFECGFNTLSNFNRQFRRITGMTPNDYKKSYFNFSKNNQALGYSN